RGEEGALRRVPSQQTGIGKAEALLRKAAPWALCVGQPAGGDHHSRRRIATRLLSARGESVFLRRRRACRRCRGLGEHKGGDQQGGGEGKAHAGGSVQGKEA